MDSMMVLEQIVAKMKDLTYLEMLEVNGGNCPMKKGKGFGYYVGYFVGLLFD